MDALPLRPLGRSGVRVTPVGLGLWQFSQRGNMAGKYWGRLAVPEMDAIVRASLDAGVNWFDTAEIYGGGLSEEALTHGLTTAGIAPGRVVVATKWWPTLRFAGSIRRTVDERLRRLGGYPIDLFQVHHPASLSTVGAQMAAMADLAAAGKIRAVGVSNFTARGMLRAHAALVRRGMALASNQVRYSLLHRKIERNGVLAAARDAGIAIIAYSPLAQGILSGRHHDEPGLVKGKPGFRRWMPSFRQKALERARPVVAVLREVAAARGATPAQVALAWLTQFHGDTVVAIPGATGAAQASENAGAMRVALTTDDLARLDEVSRPFV